MSFKSTFLIVLLLLSVLSNNSFGQKFVKYIFLENQVKLLVQKDFIESQSVDTTKNTEFGKLEKSWNTKNSQNYYEAYVFSYESNSDILTVTNTLWKEFEDARFTSSIKERKAIINNNKKAGVIEFQGFEVDGAKMYVCVFCTALNKNEYLFVRFQCLEKKKSKYINGLKESIKTLFIQ